MQDKNTYGNRLTKAEAEVYRAKDGKKVCRTCEIQKPVGEFHKARRNADGLDSHCRQCCAVRTRRWREDNAVRHKKQVRGWQIANPERVERNSQRHRMAKYGMTPDEYQELLDTQGAVCAICNKQEDAERKDGSRRALAVDHCHEVGTIRGLLCASCNIGLGCFKDSPDLLRSAAQYVSRQK